ncbi:MAG: hypothetical protein EA352_04725 [Gemmatimonadales bacterium]|nr:MAG: hypothetical protein EA352_04725 [Gemmatimonadales bacterium]
MEYFVHVDGERLRVELDGSRLVVEDEAMEADLAPDGRTPVRSVRLDSRSLAVLPRRTGRGTWILDTGSGPREVAVMDRGQEAILQARKAAGGGGPAPLKAPMPGLVVKVEVEVGQEVAPGDGVVIVEAMKMENELRAEAAARVTRIHAVEGEAVDRDTVLVEFEPLDAGEGEEADA